MDGEGSSECEIIILLVMTRGWANVCLLCLNTQMAGLGEPDAERERERDVTVSAYWQRRTYPYLDVHFSMSTSLIRVHFELVQYSVNLT